MRHPASLLLAASLAAFFACGSISARTAPSQLGSEKSKQVLARIRQGSLVIARGDATWMFSAARKTLSSSVLNANDRSGNRYTTETLPFDQACGVVELTRD